MLKIDLSKRIAVVTGASGELGRVIARTLADCGADLAICYYNARENADQVAEYARKQGVRAMVAQLDVTDESSVNALRDKVQAELGDADIIVTNAVIQCHPYPPPQSPTQHLCSPAAK